MHARPRLRVPGLIAGLTVLLGACEGGGGPVIRFMATTPHQQYETRLRDAGLDATALARDWIAAADRALDEPVDVTVPHREARYLDPTRAQAVAYALHLERGQRLVGHFSVADAQPHDVRLFVDVFFVADSARRPQFAAAADSSGWDLGFVAFRPGRYLVRVQPELLRGGQVTIDLAVPSPLPSPAGAGEGT